MSADKLQLRRVLRLDDAALLALIRRSDEYLESLYPPESNHAEPLQALVGEDSAFFAGYLDEQLVACGAVKFLENGGKDRERYGEIKRVFVDPEQRGKRLATTVMRHLEQHLLQHGVTLARLEAGPAQPEALNLYRKLGYLERGPFGRYRPDPLSVFMEKRLA